MMILLPNVPDEKLQELIRDNAKWDGTNDFDYEGLVIDVITYLQDVLNGDE